MTRNLWLRLASCTLLAATLALPAQEKKESRKKAEDAGEKAVKAKAEEKVAADAKAKKVDARAVDVENFRKSKDPAVMEIVAMHDEIDKNYTELATARNVAAGEDKEARKAERDVKTYEAKIKRQMRKLEDAVEKFTRPLQKDYEEAKRKYDGLQEKGDQLAEQKQDKKATGYYQQADRLTGKMEGAKRQLDTAESFLTFDSAVPIEGLGDEADEDDDGAGRNKGERPEKGGAKAEKAEKAGNP